MIFKNKHDKQLEEQLAVTNNSQHENTRILALVAEDYLKEKKGKRIWGWIWKGLLLAYFMVIAVLAFRSPVAGMDVSGEHTALVKLDGVIGRDPQSTAPQINEALRRAFAAKHSKGVILKINSPGGTPVQSDQINAEITRLRSEYPDKPIYAVVDDLCASGGYYIAAATQEIYANPASIVGSIGVRMGGFGFVDTMQKLGVERRLITAGSNKGMLDPFSPVNPAEVTHAETMLRQVHQQFIDAVKRGRGERLSANPDIFSGLFWSGEEAKRLGLVDDFGDTRFVAREKLEAEKVVDYSLRPSFIDRVSRGLGMSIANGLWSKMGVPSYF